MHYEQNRFHNLLHIISIARRLDIATHVNLPMEIWIVIFQEAKDQYLNLKGKDSKFLDKHAKDGIRCPSIKQKLHSENPNFIRKN